MFGKMSRFSKRNPKLVSRQLANATTEMQLESLESRELLSSYYVSTSGSDSAAGTSTAPWRTIQNAANRASAGDVVTVRAGNYAGAEFTRSGTASAPITFKADSGVYITGKNSSTADGFNLEGANYVVIDGFNVNNSSGSITRAGIRVVTGQSDVVRNNNITNSGTWGILTGFAPDVLIENNSSSGAKNQHGIYVSNSGDRPIVRGNRVFNNHMSGIQINADALMGGDGLIQGAIVENNIVYNNGSAGGAAINWDGIQDSTIRNNLLYNNYAGGIAMYQIDGAAGSKNNLVVNNTIVQASGARSAVVVANGSTGNTFYNNVFLHNGSGASIEMSSDSVSGTKSDYNVLKARTISGQDSHSIIASGSQVFVNASGNDYHLSSSSVAIDKGTSTSAPTRDMEGKVRPSGAGFDIGSYEYQSGSTPTPVTTVPVAPSALTAAAASSSQINLKWTDNSSNESGFKIERLSGGVWSQIATVAAGVTSYSNTGLAASTSYSYRVRAYNTAGDSTYTNTAAATTLAETTSTVTTFWSATSTVPANTTSSDANQVELGLKFSSSKAGYVTGLRFYKGTGNTGTHTGHLWSSTGQLLASVTFTNETASGWQTAMFSQPVAIAANTTYTISYNAPNGHYAWNSNYFTSTGLASGSLKAINSTYSYGANVFPTNNWQNANYWVDVIFKSA